MPRHSPYALIRLNFLLNFFSCSLWIAWVSLNICFGFHFAVKRFFYQSFLRFFFRPVEIFFKISPLEIVVVYPNFLERPILISCLLKCVLFYLFVSTHFTSLFGFQWTFSLPNLLVKWWAQVDSNHRPRAYQARALTTWAMSPFSFRCISSLSPLFFCLYFLSFADQVLAPATCRWWRWWDSNPWPPACRAGALPTELHPHIGVSRSLKIEQLRSKHQLTPCSVSLVTLKLFAIRHTRENVSVSP